MKVITLVGSLRAQSFNKAVANYVKESTVGTLDIEFVDIELPYFNEDLEEDKPEKVVEFLSQLETADAFLFVSPEYNHSVPGGLKNAIDWASRGDYFTKKPAFMMGASTGAIGTARAHIDLRTILDVQQMSVLPGNEVLIGRAQDKIHDGVIVDEGTKKFIDGVVANFIEWYDKVK